VTPFAQATGFQESGFSASLRRGIFALELTKRSNTKELYDGNRIHPARASLNGARSKGCLQAGVPGLRRPANRDSRQAAMFRLPYDLRNLL
jgi:hypothetical protein